MSERSLGYEGYLIPVLSLLRKGEASERYIVKRLGRKIADSTMLEFFEAQGYIHRIDKQQRDGSAKFFYRRLPQGKRLMDAVVRTVKKFQAAY